MKFYAVAILLCISIFNAEPSTRASLQEKKHDDTCPKSCKVCDPAVEKVLKYIVSQQKEDGKWVSDDPKDKEPDKMALSYTALNGFALLASGSTTKEGPYQKELAKAKKVVFDMVEGYVKSMLKAKPQNYPPGIHCVRRVDVSIATWFLVHMYQIEKTEELKELLGKVRDFIVREMLEKQGGWNYHGPLAKQSMTFVTNSNTAALVCLGQLCDLQVDDKVFENVRKCYAEFLQIEDGSLFYYLHAYSTKAKPQPSKKLAIESTGRTVAGLWTMYLLGMTKSKTYEKAKAFVDSNLDDLDRSQHGPSYHMLMGALSCFYGDDKKLWEKYVAKNQDAILKVQKEDGSILLEPRSGSDRPIDGKSFGPIYTSAIYALILQLGKGHLVFDKLKPLIINETQEKKESEK